jgi:glycosyltransferase involved in cell wall biosynthesis
VRILHVHSGNIFGGVERILIALAAHAKISADFEHCFALCFRERLARELQATGAPLFHLPEARLSKPLTVLRARRRLRELLSDIKIDLVIVHSAWSHVIFGASIRSAKIPTAFWLHTRASGKSWLERLASMHSPDSVISVSQWVDQSARELFPGVPSRVVHTPLAVDQRAFAMTNRDETRRSLGVAGNQIVILQASRMEAWKGHRELLRALNSLRANAAWVCWIAGGVERVEEKEYFDEIRRLADDLGIADRVRFLGRREDVPGLMRAADIYCQANSEAEGFSIVFLEAFFAGLPIVTTAIGGALEIVNSGCGILVPANDRNALAAALQKLIDDQELRQKLGAKGRDRALERCDPARQFGELERVFRQIHSRHG